MKSRRIFTVCSILTAFEALASIVWLALMPAEAGNALAFGYSLQRLMLMTGLLIFMLTAGWFARKIINSPEFLVGIEKIAGKASVILSAGLLLVITWVLVLSPSYQWGRWGGYKERLLPILIWILLFSIQLMVICVWLIKQKYPVSIIKVIRTDAGMINSWRIVLCVVSVFVVAVAVFRLGITPDIVYWNNFNVPILGIQIIGVLVFSLLFLGALSTTGFFSNRHQLSDFVIGILIWGFAVILWTQTPMPHSYFSPGPYSPNGEMYPFSDAAGYDTSAHRAIIGEGLGSKRYVDKPLYIAFLTGIHLLAGNRMDTVVGVQVAVVALLPVLLYLLGKRTHSRLAGFLAAGFIIFREVNNIQGTLLVLSTNTRVLMSESLVTLLLAIFVYTFTIWVNNRQDKKYLACAGGVLGLAALVRLNPLLLLPIAAGAILLLFWKQWKQGLINVVLFAGFFLLAILPWTVQSYVQHGKLLYFQSTFHGVVMEQRAFYALNTPSPKPVPESTLSPTSQPNPTLAQKPSDSEKAVSTNKTWIRITGITRYVSAHFFHNVISAAAVFPVDVTLESLEKTIKAPGSYWSLEWNGGFNAGQIIPFILTMLIFSLGMASGWIKCGFSGIVPAGFFVSYSLATAAARTSGGRYILPADWVFLLYFAFGLAQIVIWINLWLNNNLFTTVLVPVENDPAENRKMLPLVNLAVIFLLIGGTPTIFDRFISPRYTILDKTSIRQEWSEDWMLRSLDITREEWDAFITQPDAVVYEGRGLYPRFYPQNQGEPDRFSSARAQAFPRLVMDVVGPQGNMSGVLPLDKAPEPIPNGSDVTVVGCRSKLNDDWFAVIIEGQDGMILRRSPKTRWTCPATLPVCDDNRVCQ